MKTLSDLIAACHAVVSVGFGSEIMQKAAQKKIEQHNEQAVEACASLIDQFQSSLKIGVTGLRELRLREKKQAEVVQNMDKAFKYFAETGNPFPFFKIVDGDRGYMAQTFVQMANITMPVKDDDAWIVPNDWTPKQVEKTEQADKK